VRGDVLTQYVKQGSGCRAVERFATADFREAQALLDALA
jgi:hypothetical protein